VPEGAPEGAPQGPGASLGAAGFQAETGVEDATLAGLTRYADLLVKWQRAINLVSAKSLTDLWRRHMLDSAQLYPMIPPGARTLVDLGSGAGFPGLVLAILARGESRDLAVHLIESDHRKAAFLREVSRETDARAVIHAGRIETVAPFAADVVTARALAPLDRLLVLARPFIGPQTICLFPKGQDVVSELTEATKGRSIRVERSPSRSDPAATILRLTEIADA
jgi:16S rRNA (guanine527-N7)-methyltransferase